MRSFRDAFGREWNLALTTTAVLRIRDAVTIDDDGKQVPLDLGDVSTANAALGLFRNNYTKLVDVLRVVLAGPIEAKKLTAEEFQDAISGDVFEDARAALEEELIAFFPKSRREFLAVVAAEMQRAESELVKKAIADLSGRPSGKPPESSESTPGSGLSDNCSSPETDGSIPTGGTPLTSSPESTTP